MSSFIVGNELDGISVKSFLRRHCQVSARLLARLKRTENGITCKGRVLRSIDILHAGDKVELSLPADESVIVPVDLPVEIVYEDNDIVVFNKPANMPVHPVNSHRLNTLANAAAYHCIIRGEQYAFRAVNRLDKDTSGLVLTVKNGYAHTFLISHTEKRYLALCEGELYGSGTIDSPIRLKPGHTIQREVGHGGKPSVTHYRALKHGFGHTLLSLTLETGRTHQIRVHLSSIGHPLAGDDMYGGSIHYFSHQCLHCASLSFVHPTTRETLTLYREPEDWLGILEKKHISGIKSGDPSYN